jgi:hypothetical protein
MDFRAYLRNERLFTETPYEQIDLLPKERITAVPEKVVFDNFYRSPKERIYCHICGGHRHLNGITGLVNGNHRMLFGSSCAKEFFGADVTRLCAGDFKRRTQGAYDRFVILYISHSIEPIENWLKSYRHLIVHIETAWIEIHIRHEKAISPLLAHLTRNNGRLVETKHISVGGNAKQLERLEQHAIITHISNANAIPYLKQMTQRLALVETFVHAVRSVKTEPSNQMFSNLAAKHQKTLEEAKVLDACISFTNDFFGAEKLKLLAHWMEKDRQNRLSQLTEVKPQNLEPHLRRTMGSGIEHPHQSLCDAFGTTGIPEKLLQRTQRKEIKAISAI